MPKPISIALVGIGGYGNDFVNAVLDAPDQTAFRLAGTIDPNPVTCRRFDELQGRKVPHYSALGEFIESDHADLVVLASPIQFHAVQTRLALENGSHVLCEKPLCASLDQARRMRDARQRAGKSVAIGYQWSFSETIQRLKADVINGVLGNARRLRTLVLWPRDEAYYARNRWAGAIVDARGNPVLDSPVNNACAHYLHNMLYVLGASVDRSAAPLQVTAELYRAYAIPNYDTAAMRVVTTDGVELIFLVSHCTANQQGPIFSYEFENATVELLDHPGATIVAKFKDGLVRDYGIPDRGGEMKLWQTVDAIRNNAPTVCGIEAAFAHTQCVLAAQESAPSINSFPPALVRVAGEPGNRNTIVEGLGFQLNRCYEQGKLPSELKIDWAKPGKAIQIGLSLGLANPS